MQQDERREGGDADKRQTGGGGEALGWVSISWDWELLKGNEK